MIVDELYVFCKERLKTLRVELGLRGDQLYLQGRHTGGFDVHYSYRGNQKHIIRVLKGEGYPPYLAVDVKKADGSWTGEQLVKDKEAFEHVLANHIKPKIAELRRVMRIAKWYNNKDVRVEEMPVPKIGPGEMLVRVEASGICGSDVMEWYRIDRAPLVLGHEIGGQVAAVGEGVTRCKEGDRVTVAHHVPCNTCHYCLTGHHTACETLRRTNFDPGGLAEHLRVPAINVDRGVFLLPDEMSYQEATFIEPLACVLRGLRRANFQPGANVLVIGSGIAGLLFVQLARALGAGRVVVTDINDFRMEKARRFGAEAAFHPDVDLPAELRRLNHGYLADVVVVSTGATSAQTQALKCVDRGGTVLFFAPTNPGVTVPVSINEFFFRNDYTLTTSYAGSPADYQTALDIIRAGNLPVKEMITHVLPMAEVGKGFRLVAEARNSIKVIIEPQR